MIPDDEAGRERFEARLEVLIAVGLGLAAILTALSVYLTDIHDDDAQVAFNSGVREVTEATGGYVQSAQTQAADQALFAEYAQLANAGANGDRAAFEAAAYLQTSVMRPDLRKMVEWWADEGSDQGAATPFVADNPFFEQAELDAAEAGSAEAEEQFATAQVELERGDTFIIASVIVASALFLFGVAGVARVLRLKVAMTGLAYAALFVALGVTLANL
jgi:hypothetical protein